MLAKQVRFGDFVKHEDGYSPIDKILCIDIVPQGDTNHPDTKNQDAFYVEITLDWLDLWLPDKKTWEKGPKYSGHLQASEYMKFEVFRGTEAECEEIVQQIIAIEEPNRRTEDAREIYDLLKETPGLKVNHEPES